VVLEVRDLRTSFSTEAGVLRAVDNVSFDVCAGEVLGVVGESGCGKTVTAMSIMGLLPRPAGRIESGKILFKGDDLVTMKPRQRRAIAGDRISMVFQDPLTALNPVYRIGSQITELIRAHRDLSRREAWTRAVELLGLVGIPNPGDRARDYPHQFSGGMRQRAVIAMAIALNPDLLIADEPTTALDVTVQAQILEVLLRVRDQLGMAIMLITHDLGVVAEVAERVMVMYAGKKVEEAPVDVLYERPKHPYTWGLLAATTRADRPAIDRLYQITGAPPSLLHPPPACRFAPRCPHVQAICREVEPELRLVGDSQEAACHFADQADWGPQRDPAAVANITYEIAAE
jgi:oligopeptide/dipeptide ABC transporter ATP-binding protein